MLQDRVDRAETRASIAPDHAAILLSIEIDMIPILNVAQAVGNSTINY